MPTKYKIIRVVRTDDYFIPMSSDGEHSVINGWTPEHIRKDWFEDYDINSSHAARDGYRVGNASKILMSVVIDEQYSYNKRRSQKE